MRVAEYAENLLRAETLETKLLPPPSDLLDGGVGPVEIPEFRRPPGLEVRTGGVVRVPRPMAWQDPRQRVRILHALANHELQAAELFAWALLAFPDAPSVLRRGWLRILGDEQRHCGLYLERLAAHGARFGDFGVSGHFWSHVDEMTTPLRFVCAMGMTFENANLDFTDDYITAARAADDEESAQVLAIVHSDEVRHVQFAWEWLVQLKPAGMSAWDAYVENVSVTHGPPRARGARFDRESRLRAGFDAEFIARLEASQPERPGGTLRT
jgi:uncharacterized ferritin-like protein (DUF455 family)